MPANLENSAVATGISHRKMLKMYAPEAEIDVFLELSCFSHDPVDVGNLIAGSSAFSKSSFNIWKFLVYLLLKPGLENFQHFLLACEMSAIVQ